MQFCRCLDQHLSVRLSEADYEFLVSKYGDKDKDTVNYRAFCKAMEDGVWGDHIICVNACSTNAWL